MQGTPDVCQGLALGDAWELESASNPGPVSEFPIL